MRNTAVLLIDCPDRIGLVAGVANLLYRYGANITHADQHQDPEAELFFMRMEWELAGFDLSAFREEFQALAGGFQMRWRLHLMSQPPRVAIFVSRYLHCLADLLHRHTRRLRRRSCDPGRVQAHAAQRLGQVLHAAARHG